jgi:hypothetical protein
VTVASASSPRVALLEVNWASSIGLIALDVGHARLRGHAPDLRLGAARDYHTDLVETGDLIQAAGRHSISCCRQ